MIFAIGSKNKAKQNACFSAVEKLKNKFPEKFNTNINFLSIQAQSSVSDMPLTLNELLNGARNRALFTYKTLNKSNSVSFAIGMEGGVFNTTKIEQDTRQVILQNWVYVYNGKVGYFGCSAGIPLPEKISKPLYSGEQELADVIDLSWVV